MFDKNESFININEIDKILIKTSYKTKTNNTVKIDKTILSLPPPPPSTKPPPLPLLKTNRILTKIKCTLNKQNII